MEDIEQLVEAYLNGNLSEEEKRLFEEKVKEDSSFEEEVQQHAVAMESIRMMAKTQMQTRVAREFSRAQFRRRRRNLLLISSAAIFALLLATFMFFQNSSSTLLSPKELFATYYTLPSLDEVRDLASSDSLLMLASQAYEQKQFVEAQKSLQMLAVDSTYRYYPRVVFLAGITALELGDTQMAVQYLQKVDMNSTYGASANWYTGLAYLKMGESAEAKTIMSSISQSSISRFRPYKSAASEILQQLKERE